MNDLLRTFHDLNHITTLTWITLTIMHVLTNKCFKLSKGLYRPCKLFIINEKEKKRKAKRRRELSRATEKGKELESKRGRRGLIGEGMYTIG